MGRDPLARARGHARLSLTTATLGTGTSTSAQCLARDLVRRDPDAGPLRQREDLDMPLLMRSGVFDSGLETRKALR